MNKTARACLITAIVLLFTSTSLVCIHGSSITIDDDMQAYLLRGGFFEEREGFGRNTYGGLGGEVYHVTTLADSGPGSLRAGAESDDPLWIVFDVSGTIQLTSKIQVKSNKTIDGRGAEITITRHGFVISGVYNVIVTNLVFDTGDAEDDNDGMTINNNAHDVWVHHCSFTNWYDGCLDIKRGSTDVTVSWCKFWDHEKTMLIGHSPTQTSDVVIRVTLHHNFFNGTQSRHPRLRFGKVDAYNNYLYDWKSYGMATCMFGQLLVEANIFEAESDKDAVLTIYGSDPDSGYSKLVNNTLLNGAVANENEPENVFDRSTYYNATIETADNALKEKIVAGAGARKRVVTRYPWTMFHHYLNNTGYTDSPAPKTNKILWIRYTGNIAAGGPAVVDGLVFVGSTSNNVYALNMTTGDTVWTYTAGDAVRSAPAVADGLVFICSNDGNIYCLDEFTGLKVWNQTTYVDGIPHKLERIHPAVYDGKVFYGGYDGNLTARNMYTGELVWNYQTGDTVRGCPAIVNGIVYTGSADNRTYALNATTGEQLWNYTTGGDVRGSITVAGGLVFFGSNDKNVTAINVTTGELVWNYTTGGYVRSTPAVAGGLVFIGSMDRKVYALNMTTGEKVWSYTTGLSIEYASPAVADGIVFIGSQDDTFYAFNMTTGTVVWSYNTGGDIRGSPAVVDDLVFVGAFNGRMYAFGGLPKAPEANFTFSPANPIPSQVVTFDASDSQPGWNVTESPIISYKWDFDDGNVTTVTVPTITHSYAEEKTYTVTLNVTDDKGVSDTTTAGVTVSHVYDVAIISVTASPTTVKVGESVNITVVVKNNGTDTETFDVATYYDNTTIGNQTVYNLAPEASETLTFTWATANVSPETWTIKAVASTLAGETETADNTRIDGTVTIEKLNSTISISASPTTITVGADITINGSISPVRAGVNVTIQYRPSGGTWSILANETTDTDGQYSYTWTPTAAGTYEVKASWAGDAQTLADESDAQTVTVQEAKIAPIIYAAAGIAIVVAVAIVIYVLRAGKS